MPAVAGAGVLAVVIIAGISGRGGATSADTVPTTVAAAAPTSAAITTLPIVVNTDPAIVKTTLAQAISKGNAGGDVEKVQQRLTDLGFAPGPIDNGKVDATKLPDPERNRRSGRTRSWS